MISWQYETSQIVQNSFPATDVIGPGWQVYGPTPRVGLMPYRASNPLYSLIGYYTSPGSVTRTFDATHLCYAVLSPGPTIRSFGGGTGTINLGDLGGTWAIYSASATHVLTDGPSNNETVIISKNGVTTSLEATVMGLTYAPLATTFPRGGNVQYPFAQSGQIIAASHPMVTAVTTATSTAPTPDMAVYAGSVASSGAGSISGTIRQDSLGSPTFLLFTTPSFFKVFFNCGTVGVSVYDVVANALNQTAHPGFVAGTFSLLPV